MTDRGFVFNNLVSQAGANAIYAYQIEYEATNGKPYQFKSQTERIQALIGRKGQEKQYLPNLYCKFYRITPGVIPSFFGPPNTGWLSQIGNAGAYPMTFNNGFPGITDYFNIGMIAKGYVYSQYATTIRLQTISDDGVVVLFNGVPVINNWTFHSSTTDTSPLLQLLPGYTPIEVRFFNGSADGVCQLFTNIGETGFNQNSGVLFNTACSR